MATLRAVSSIGSVAGCLSHTASSRLLQTCAFLAIPHRRHQRRCTVRASSNNGVSGRSSSSSSSNAWLVDGPTSLHSDITTSSSGSGSTTRFDAIMMLGGGLLPDGGLPEWVVRRLEGSLHLYQQQQQLRASQCSQSNGMSSSSQERRPSQLRPWAAAAAGTCPIVLLGAATPHKPPVMDDLGYVLYESTAYATYLMQRGVPAADLLKETQSCDTVGNAYFSLLMHALPAGLRSIAVVTSEFHMPRTQATFDFTYRLAGQQLHGDPDWYCLHYRAVSDEGIFEPEVIQARAAKEATAVATWHANTAAIRSLADLHSWLYATHLCYSVSRQHEFGRAQDLDPKLAATY